MAAPPVLSKYEHVQVVAARVEQLLAGAPRMVTHGDEDDVTVIAENEISQRVLPVRIARRLPNGKVRVHELRDFIDVSVSEPKLVPPKVSTTPARSMVAITKAREAQEAQEAPPVTTTVDPQA